MVRKKILIQQISLKIFMLYALTEIATLEYVHSKVHRYTYKYYHHHNHAKPQKFHPFSCIIISVGMYSVLKSKQNNAITNDILSNCAETISSMFFERTGLFSTLSSDAPSKVFLASYFALLFHYVGWQQKQW